MRLHQNATLDTRLAPAVTEESEPFKWGGGNGFFVVRNITGAGAITMQVQEPLTGDWIATDMVIDGDDGIKAFVFPIDTMIRMVLTGGAPSAVVAHIVREPRAKKWEG